MSTIAQTWLARHCQTVEPVYRDSCLAAWNANVTGDPRHEEEAARHESALRKLYSSEAEFEEVRAYRADATTRDPLTSRQLDLVHNDYLANQMKPEVIDALVRLDKEIEGEFNKFRAKLGSEEKTDNQLKTILQKEDSSERRKAAWEASKQVGSRVAERVRELARMRNAEARRLGFRDYFAMRLKLQELDEARLFQTFERLFQLSEAPYAQYKQSLDESLARRFGMKPSQLRPWHYSDPFFQEAPAGEVDLDPTYAARPLEPLSVAHFTDMGMDVEDILGRSDLYEKPGKCQHAFCISIDRKDDVRILCNIVPNERWMGTLLHELGHAVYDKYLDRSLPFSLRLPAHTLTTEAIAMLHGRFAQNDAWLARYVGVPADEAKALGAALRRRLGQHLLILTRWVMVMTYFERDLYADPERDLNTLWWDYAERFQKLVRPEGRKAPDWASKIHIATAPVYYQNYLLGEMVASQLSSHISRNVLGDGQQGLSSLVGRPEVGEYLKKEVFEVGARYPWEEQLKRATGEGLNPEHFVGEYA